MAWDLRIATVSQKTKIDLKYGVTIEQAQNERSTLRFRTQWSENYLPARLATVEAYEPDGVTLKWAGVIIRRKVEPVGPVSYRATVTCADWWYYLGKSYVTLVFSTPVTLKAVLEAIVSQLHASLSFTVHAGQVTGPTLAAYTFSGTAEAAIKDAVSQAGANYAVKVTPAKAIRAYVPGTVTSSLSVTDATPNCRSLALSDPTRTPVNRVILRCGPSGVIAGITQTWTTDGVATTFALDGVNVPASSAWPGIVTVNGVSYPMHLPGAAPGGNGIEWDYETDGGTVSFLGTAAALVSTGGQPVVLTYDGASPFDVSIASGATPVTTELRSAEWITVWAHGEAYATSLYDSLTSEPRTAELFSLTSGWEIGEGVTVNISYPPVNETFTIERVTTRLKTDEFWTYDVEMLEDDVRQGSDLDLWREAVQKLSTGGASASSGSVSIVTLSGSASPFPLGGKREQSLGVGTTRTPVIDWLPFIPLVDMTIRVRCTVRARDAGVTVTPHLEVYNSGGMTWDSHVAGSGVVGTTATEQTFTAALTAGETYRLAYVTNTAGASAYCIGQKEDIA